MCAGLAREVEMAAVVRIKIQTRSGKSDVELDASDDMVLGLKTMYSADMSDDSDVAKTYRAYIEACKAAKSK